MDTDFQLFSSLRYDPLLLDSTTNATLAMGKPSPYYMLEYHRDRILYAAEHFDWQEAVSHIRGSEGLVHITQKLDEATSDSNAPLRIRILLGRNGALAVESNPTPTVSISNLFPELLPPPKTFTAAAKETSGISSQTESNVSVSAPSQTTCWIVSPDTKGTPPTSFTRYKTTSRDMYTDARKRVGIKTMTEPHEVLIVSSDNGEIMEGSLTSVFFWRGGRWVTPPAKSGGQSGTTRRWLLERGMCFEEQVYVDSLVDDEECWISNGARGLIRGRVKL